MQRTQSKLYANPSRHELRQRYDVNKIVSHQERQYRINFLKQRIDTLLESYTTDKDTELKELVLELKAIQD